MATRGAHMHTRSHSHTLTQTKAYSELMLRLHGEPGVWSELGMYISVSPAGACMCVVFVYAGTGSSEMQILIRACIF